MAQFLSEDKCKVNTNKGTDTFVGIKYDKGDIYVSFPLGYHLDDGRATRDDVFLLIRTLARNCRQKKSEMMPETGTFTDDIDFPMMSYLYIISDFLERGYYKETESQNKVSKRGKIDWPKTIKTQKPYIQNENAVYLDFVTKKEQINEDQLITRIHEYCVYESFEKMGWLYTDRMPSKPRIKLQKNLFLSVLRDKLNATFNDRNRKLFENMYAIISSLGDDQANNEFTYGTTDFEYVWERMVDRFYGITDKDKYFPKTRWTLQEDGKTYNNSSLIPDTIMLLGNKAYILDSKYYKYGVTKYPADLPDSSSISKQIIYGEHVAKKGNFEAIFNAFIMPFDSQDGKFNSNDPLSYVGYATSEWKSGENEYEKVLGFLMDVKYLMKKSTGRDEREIEVLARKINQLCRDE